MRDLSRDQIGVVSAAAAALIFGTSFPVTAIALRSFTPLGAAAFLDGLTGRPAQPSLTLDRASRYNPDEITRD